MTILDNKLYVTNSRENNNTVSIVDLSDFSTGKSGEIEVHDNPAQITKDNNGNLYVISWGIWDQTPSKLHKVETRNNNKVTELGTDVASQMLFIGNKLILMKLTYSPNTTAFGYYDLSTSKIVNESFITDGTTITNGNSLTYDSSMGNIYVGTGDYQTLGKMYIFSPDGKLIRQFETGGYYPMGAYIIP